MTEDEIILTHILKCRSIDLALSKPVLSESQQLQFREFKRRRLAAEPLQYILGTCNFMGLELMVNPSVLVPRPETEQLVDNAIKELMRTVPSTLFNKGLSPLILDLGTGSGNIAIALAKFVAGSKIVTVEKSLEAISVARENARTHKIENRIQFVHDDILAGLQKMGTSPNFGNSKQNSETSPFFDLIISNPPYIPTAQLKTLPVDVQQEPKMALDGGPDGLDFYRQIIKYTPGLLRSRACLMMEFGDGQVDALKGLALTSNAFSKIEIFKDLAGRDRMIKAIRS